MPEAAPTEPESILDAQMPVMETRLDSEGPVDMGDVPESLFTAPADQHEAPIGTAIDPLADNQSGQPEEQAGILAELANASALPIEEPSAQLDIEEAVARIDDLANEAETEAKNDEQDKGADDNFILSAPVIGKTDEALQSADAIPETRPSIIKQISGLWRARPSADEEEMVKKEPAKAEEPAILNLSRGSALQETLPIGNQTHQESNETDDELDIPAFLRRQAN